MRIGLLAALFCVMAVSVGRQAEASPLAQGSPYQILFRSRQFVPVPGIDDRVRARLQAQKVRRHVILQLNSIPDQREQQALAARGIQLLNYIPNRAWFAALEPEALSDLSSANELRWLGDIQIADKLPAHLLNGRPLSHALNADGTLTVRMNYFADLSEAEAAELVARHAGRVEQRVPELHAMTLQLPLEQVVPLAAEDGVRWLAEAPLSPTPFNDSIRSRIRVDDVQAAPYNLSGAGIVLGMWDCGPVGPHIDFAGRLINVSGQVNGCGSAPTHSTHVAGVMAGSGQNSQAQAGTPFQWKGMAPAAQLIAYDYFSSTVEVRSAMNTYHIDLANNSWGFVPDAGEDCQLTYGNYNNLAPDYDQIVTGLYGKRITVTFAAGNKQGACGVYDTITPPGTAKNVITVGATNSNDDTLTAFSSLGPTDDGRTKPDVVAPGCRTDWPFKIKSTFPNDQYGLICGTSMATPAVSGMLALMLQQYRQLMSMAPNPLPSTLKALAIHGAIDLGSPGPDFRFGFGRVDAKNSVELIRRTKYREGALNSNQVVTFTANVLSCDTSLKATLVWDDPAATENALVAWVNDLDLTLIAPNGTPYFPWILDPAEPDAPASRGVDFRNNVEQVLVDSPMAGAWTIKVSGQVPVNAPQRFSVVSEALPTTPTLTSVTPSLTQGGAQLVLRGSEFGCSPAGGVVNFGGNVSTTVAPGNWTNETVTVTVPFSAQSGNVSVITPGGTSNAIYISVLRPSAYLPFVPINFPPPFNWIDASSGIRIANADDISEAVNMPFPFKFFGNTYTTTYVSSNGLVSFGAGYTQSSNSCIPNPDPPNNAIYAFWTDLDPGKHGAVWAQVVGNSLVIEWQDVPRYGTYPTTELETFEIILNSDNSIIIQYKSILNTNNAVVGIENLNGTYALQSYCNGLGSAPSNSQVLYYTTQ